MYLKAGRCQLGFSSAQKARDVVIVNTEKCHNICEGTPLNDNIRTWCTITILGLFTYCSTMLKYSNSSGNSRMKYRLQFSILNFKAQLKNAHLRKFDYFRQSNWSEFRICNVQFSMYCIVSCNKCFWELLYDVMLTSRSSSFLVKCTKAASHAVRADSKWVIRRFSMWKMDLINFSVAAFKQIWCAFKPKVFYLLTKRRRKPS